MDCNQGTPTPLFASLDTLDDSDGESACCSELDLRPSLKYLSSYGDIESQDTTILPMSAGFQTIPYIFDCKVKGNQGLLLPKAACLNDNTLATNGLRIGCDINLQQDQIKQLPTIAQFNK
jgi:hypothetical protein